MKKIININFHSRVIPIEETAYEILQQYVESLRRHFANEEGRDEIISDIENRFAELFSESLKKGATCITDADVNAIITSMGRPEELVDEQMAGAATGTGSTGSANQSSGYVGSGGAAGGQGSTDYQDNNDEPRRLYRAENEKILGGVCGGLANYLRLDPAIVRIIFVLITFGWGAGVLLYCILWAVLPHKSLPVNARKRLYRNSDDRVIGGVASGLAAYFHIEVWVPRLIFAAPLILSILASILGHALDWWDYDTPSFISGGFGGTLFITYIVLWIVLPEAITASEKLEMRGEKVDLESIKNTIKSDLENFSKRAKDTSAEVKESFQKAGEHVRKSTQNFAAETGPVIRKGSSGFGHAVGVLFKAFFLFIAGIIAFALITALASLAFRGEIVIAAKNYVLEGVTQNALLWAAFIGFFVIPVVALLTWLIRRITGVRSKNHYLGYAFATLWVIGLVCLISLAASIMRNFSNRQHVEETVNLSMPSHDRLVIKTTEGRGTFDDGDWFFDWDWKHDGPFRMLNDDSLVLNTVRVNLLKSTDSTYHAQIVKFSHGNTSTTARELAAKVDFKINQQDSVLYLPYGFPVTKNQKFRNQQVLVNVYIPVGKKILVHGSVDDYDWFDISTRNRHIHWNKRHDGWDGDWDDNEWEVRGKDYTTNVEYIMTDNGLVSTRSEDARDRKKNRDRERNEEKKDDDKTKDEDENPGYRYKGPGARPAAGGDSVKRTAVRTESTGTHTYLLSALFSM